MISLEDNVKGAGLNHVNTIFSSVNIHKTMACPFIGV